MSFNEYLNTSGNIALVGGGWANAAGTSSTLGNPSSANLKVTTNIGDTCTITWTGRAMHLFTQTYYTRGPFTVTDNVNGAGAVPIYGDFDCSNSPTCADGTVSNGGYYNRVSIPIIRGAPIGSTHVTVLTAAQTTYRAVAGKTGISVDSVVVFDGPQLSPTIGNLVHIGDSQGVSGGSEDYYGNVYPWVNARGLQVSLQRSISLLNGCVGGNCWFGVPGAGGANATVGGMYRTIGSDGTFTGVLAQAPEFLAVMFGANDLRAQASGGSYVGAGCSAADFARHVNNWCCMVEDALDLYGAYGTAVKVCVASPCYLAPNMM